MINTIAPGDLVTVSQDWTPEIGHRCIEAKIVFGFDSDFSNNVTQRNITVKQTSSPAVFSFNVENPLTVPATILLKAISDNPDWTCSLNQTRFPLHPFNDCPRPVAATLTPIRPGPGTVPVPNRHALLGGVSVRAIDASAGTATCHIFVESLPCDVNADGKVDISDINAIFAARNIRAQAADPRDPDGDGMITVDDARICALKCAKPGCTP
jgi:hypothetical protein